MIFSIKNLVNFNVVLLISNILIFRRFLFSRMNKKHCKARKKFSLVVWTICATLLAQQPLILVSINYKSEYTVTVKLDFVKTFRENSRMFMLNWFSKAIWHQFLSKIINSSILFCQSSYLTTQKFCKSNFLIRIFFGSLKSILRRTENYNADFERRLSYSTETFLDWQIKQSSRKMEKTQREKN